jgi:hypothetical protein
MVKCACNGCEEKLASAGYGDKLSPSPAPARRVTVKWETTKQMKMLLRLESLSCTTDTKKSKTFNYGTLDIPEDCFMLRLLAVKIDQLHEIPQQKETKQRQF